MPTKIKDPDPLAMDHLDPLTISEAVEARKQPKQKQPNEVELKKEERLAMKEQRLSSGAQGASGSTEPPQLTPEERTKLLDKLTAYKDRFPHLKTRNKTLKTADDILDELHYVEVQLGSKSGSLGVTLFHGTMCALEYSTAVYNPLNLNLAGLGEITKQNMSEFEPIVDELMIKYGSGTYLAPEYRLMFAVGAMVFTVHTANSGDPALAQAMHRVNAVVKKPPKADGL